MIGMNGEEIEERLAKAAAGVREHEIVGLRCEELGRNVAALQAALDKLSLDHEREARDVERLQGLSLTGIIASLRGSRESTLEREKAEADAAAYRLREAQGRLDAMVGELRETEVRQARLSLSLGAYTAAQADKEKFLMGGNDRRGVKLTELAEARGRLEAELTEVDEAIAAAEEAKQALAILDDLLGSASAWSTYDTFFGGGAISSAVKHSRLDEAAQAANAADHALARLRTELTDIPGATAALPGLNIEELTRFVDIWLDNIFTDVAVMNRINSAKENVRGAVLRVDQILTRLDARRSDGQQRQSALEAERERLLS